MESSLSQKEGNKLKDKVFMLVQNPDNIFHHLGIFRSHRLNTHYCYINFELKHRTVNWNSPGYTVNNNGKGILEIALMQQTRKSYNYKKSGT